MSDNSVDDGAISDDFTKRLSWSLLACRVVVFIVFAAYAYATITRPEMNADALHKVYYIKGIPTVAMMVLGIAQLAVAFAVLLGLFKKLSRGILLALSVLAMFVPTYLVGYFMATIGGVAHPAILYFTSFCLFACTYMIFALRDHDTLYTLKGKETS